MIRDLGGILYEAYNWIAMTVAYFLEVLLIDSFVKNRGKSERSTADRLKVLLVPRDWTVIGYVVLVNV